MLSYAIFQGTHCYFEQLAPPFTGRKAVAAMTKEIVPGFFNYAGFPYNRDWYLAEVVDFRKKRTVHLKIIWTTIESVMPFMHKHSHLNGVLKTLE